MAKNNPRKGYVWSERLQKYRRPAIRKFMADRQGIHAIIGVLVGLFWLLLLAIPHIANPVAAAVFGGAVLLVQVLAYVRFNRYEEVEAKEIDDDGYIDLGGEMGGWYPTSAIALIIVAIYLAVML